MLLRKFAAALACVAASLASTAFALVPLPPTPSVRIAVNPVTNKVYAVNKDANTVTVLDAASGTTTSIAVGAGPDFVAVDPTRNRIFVDNTRDASLTVINGATDAVIGTYNIGSMGPITINTDPTSLQNVVYVMRMTSAATDEVTYFYPNNDSPTWYTVATDSFQPSAVAVNPATHTIFVTHYATGDLRIIDGTFNGQDFPHPPSIGMWSTPFAVAANPVTNKVYVTTEDSRGPIGVVDPATLTAVFPAVAANHAVGPKALVVNPVSNKVYAAFSGEIIVIDGATNALTYVPIANAGSGAISLGIDYGTNRIYAATELGTLSVIDGDSATVVSSTAIAAGTSSIGVNPVTHAVYLYSPSGLASMAGAAGSAHTVPITTTITPFAGNTSAASNTFSLSASSGFAPAALPIRKVYYRIDSTTGAWREATASTGGYSGSFSALPPGAHTIYAFAVDDQAAPLYTGGQSIPLVGQIASYAFTVGDTKTTPTVSLASSANPANVGQSVSLTASVTGSSGAASGTMTFRDGTTVLCSSVALSSGAAACATSSLAAGSHSITAQYSGDTHYNGATSSALTQTIAKWSATASLTSSANPSVVGATVAFNATVAGGSGTPTGSITFLDGTNALCTGVAISAGRASCSTGALTAGNHSIVARYSGDATYNGVDSSALSQAVNAPAKATPTVAIASSSNPSTAGQSVSFSATVSGGTGTATGSVTFLDGGNAISGCASLALAGGNASCNAGALTAGVHSITAQYSGDATYNAAASGTLNQTVNAPPPSGTIDLALSQSAMPNPAIANQDMTFTLTVVNSGSIDASGVTLTDTIPSGTSFISASAGCSNASGTVSCAIGSVASGAGASVQITLRPAAAGTVTNNASVAATQNDPNTANNGSSLAVTVNDATATGNTLQGLSTRAGVLTGDNVLIGGFVIGGSAPKTVVVRARGPSLGVPGALADPTLTLVPANGDPTITNDDWQSASNAAQLAALGMQPGTPKESAILVTLNPGAYTAIVSGAGGTTGVGIVEIFEVDHPEVPMMAISTRGRVATGDQVVIGGFIIPGSTPRTVVVRARGPSLGVPGALANPTLTVVPANGDPTITNDDWQTDARAAQLQALNLQPGTAQESALLLTLSPGAYTAIMSGVGGTTGVGIVEIIAVQ